MIARKIRHDAPSRPDNWVVSPRYQAAPGRGIWNAGDMFTIRGQRGGRFVFIEHVTVPAERGKPQREWLYCYGGTKDQPMMRSFPPDKIGKRLRPQDWDEARAAHKFGGHGGGLAGCMRKSCREFVTAHVRAERRALNVTPIR